MQIKLTPQAKEDLNFWLKTGNRPIVQKILQLIEAIKENPFEGAGKPEPLKQNFFSERTKRRMARLILSFRNRSLKWTHERTCNAISGSKASYSILS